MRGEPLLLVLQYKVDKSQGAANWVGSPTRNDLILAVEC